MTPYVQVRSEIGPLKRVLVHRPGPEMERLMPWSLGEMLFEDIPWVSRMREEHDAFVTALHSCGAEVIYVEDLIRDVLADDGWAVEFADQIMDSEIGRGLKETLRLKELFLAGSAEQRTAYAIGGLSTDGLPHTEPSLSDYFAKDVSYILYPLPNMYFSRDPAAAIGQSLVISSMNTEVRQREARLLRLVATHHPLFAGCQLLCDNELYHLPLEGGDLLVLSDKVVAVGCSQRTSLQAVEYLAQRLLSQQQGYERVLAISIPNERAFMHLDTVMTMVDRDCFVVYPGVLRQGEAVELSRGNGGRMVYQHHVSIQQALCSVLGQQELRFIYSGGGNPQVAAREQWNDATNTLCVSPGKAIVYNRNDVSNRCLQENGIELIQLEGSELVRGRGGPRCMSMPLFREEL